MLDVRSPLIHFGKSLVSNPIRAEQAIRCQRVGGEVTKDPARHCASGYSYDAATDGRDIS